MGFIYAMHLPRLFEVSLTIGQMISLTFTDLGHLFSIQRSPPIVDSDEIEFVLYVRGSLL